MARPTIVWLACIRGAANQLAEFRSQETSLLLGNLIDAPLALTPLHRGRNSATDPSFRKNTLIHIAVKSITLSSNWKESKPHLSVSNWRAQ